MSNSNSEVYHDSSSNVVNISNEKVSTEASASDTQESVIRDDHVNKNIKTSDNLPINASDDLNSNPIISKNTPYASSAREGTARGRGKSMGSRRNDNMNNGPSSLSSSTTSTSSYDRYKPQNYNQGRGTMMDTSSSSNQGTNRGNGPYIPQKNRSRSGEFQQSSNMYTPASPQHSIGHSGSTSPASKPSNSPSGVYPLSPTLLPEGMASFYGPTFAPLPSGIAAMPRPIEGGGYYPSQGPNQMDKRFPPNMAINQGGGQPVMMPTVQYVTMPGVQLGQSSPGKPGQMPIMPVSSMQPGLAPASVMGMTQGQPFYPVGVLHPNQHMQMPIPMNQQQMIHNFPQYPYNPNFQTSYMGNPQTPPKSVLYGMNSPSYAQQMNSTNNQQNNSNSGNNYNSNSNSNNNSNNNNSNNYYNNNRTSMEPAKPRQKFTIKDKKGNVIEDVNAYAKDNITKKVPDRSSSLVKSTNEVPVESLEDHKSDEKELNQPLIEKTIPSESEPVSSEPVSSEPVSSEPVSSEPVSSEPVSSEPISSERVSSEPISSEPVSSEPEEEKERETEEEIDPPVYTEKIDTITEVKVETVDTPSLPLDQPVSDVKMEETDRKIASLSEIRVFIPNPAIPTNQSVSMTAPVSSNSSTTINNSSSSSNNNNNNNNNNSKPSTRKDASSPSFESMGNSRTTATNSTVTATTTTTTTATFTSEKSKKALWKEKFSSHRDGDILDAYTDPTPPIVTAAVTTVIQSVQAEVPPEIMSKDNSVSSQDPAEEVDEDWEITVDKIESGQKSLNIIADTPVKANRSLRPQGNLKLNSGPTSRPSPMKMRYCRDDILKERMIVFPPDVPIPDRPTNLSRYAYLYDPDLAPPTPSSSSSSSVATTTITTATATASSSNNSNNSNNHNNMTSGHRSQQTSKSGNTNRSNSDSNNNSNNSNNNTSNNNNSNNNSRDRDTMGQEQYNDGAWKRDMITNLSGGRQNYQDRQGSRNQRALPVPPPPKKVISDPLEALTLQVRAILNKITPQTFEKLAGQIKDLKITSSKLCDRLVSLIFEKAIYEQNFSNLYADLCLDLEKQLSNWPFIHVIYFRDSNQYSWVIDIDSENRNLAGPYSSPKECVNAAANDILPPTRSISYNLEIHELIVSNNILVKIYKNLTNSTEEQYYCGFIAVRDIPAESMSSVRFSSLEDANKSARKKNTVKGRLLKFCEDEFYESSEKSAKYEAVEKAYIDFERNKYMMSPEEVLLESQRIEELQDKLKRRMLGTIRFIGELFKKGLATTQVVIACMTKLLCDDTTNSNGSPKDFKPNPADIDLEVLCKLVRTVGKEFYLQSQAKSSGTDRLEAFNLCLKRMHDLSQDKKRSSRIRFSLEEVLQLRENNWVERRQEEGPLTIDEIHRRIDEENRRSSLPPTSYASTGSSSSSSSKSILGRLSDPTTGRTTSGRNASGKGYSNDGPNTKLQGGDKRASYNGESQKRMFSDNVIPNTTKTSQVGDDFKPQAILSATATTSSSSSSRGISDSIPPSRSQSMTESDMLKASFEDYLRSPTESDILEIISEYSPGLIASLTSIILNRYILSTNQSTHSAIQTLLIKLQQPLRRSKVEVLSEISKCEQLRLLSDCVLDMKQAPELFGQFIGTLLSIEVLDLPWLEDFTKSVYDENVEFSDMTTVVDVYKRLLDTAKSFRP